MGTAGEERLRQRFAKFTTSSGWGQQIATDAMQELPAEGEFFLAETIGEETKAKPLLVPEVADALKAGRQGVEEKAADELLGGDG